MQDCGEAIDTEELEIDQIKNKKLIQNRIFQTPICFDQIVYYFCYVLLCFVVLVLEDLDLRECSPNKSFRIK